MDDATLTLTEAAVAALVVATNGAVAYIFANPAYSPLLRVVIACLGVAVTLYLLFSVLKLGPSDHDGNDGNDDETDVVKLKQDVKPTLAQALTQALPLGFFDELRHEIEEIKYEFSGSSSGSGSDDDSDKGTVASEGLAVADAGDIAVVQMVEADDIDVDKDIDNDGIRDIESVDRKSVV